MTEREKFEKYMTGQGCDISMTDCNSPIYMSRDVQGCWLTWQAALSTRKDFAFGLVDKDGKPWCDCATQNEDFLRQEYDRAYPASAPFRVVELFYEDSES